MFTLDKISVIVTLTHSYSVIGWLTQLLLERGPNLRGEGNFYLVYNGIVKGPDMLMKQGLVHFQRFLEDRHSNYTYSAPIPRPSPLSY